MPVITKSPVERRDEARNALAAAREQEQQNKTALAAALVAGDETSALNAQRAAIRGEIEALELLLHGDGTDPASGLTGLAEIETRQRLRADLDAAFERRRVHQSALEAELRIEKEMRAELVEQCKKIDKLKEQSGCGVTTADVLLQRHRAAHPWIIEETNDSD